MGDIIYDKSGDSMIVTKTETDEFEHTFKVVGFMVAASLPPILYVEQ